METLCGFSIPIDIENDVIYCQKMLRSYLKVHQIIVTRMGHKAKLQPIRRHLDELETEIYDINCEQKMLLQRLRSSLDEYYNKSVNEIENPKEYRENGNLYITQLFSHHVEDPNFPCEPINVKKRLTEKQLISKFIADEQQRKVPSNSITKQISGVGSNCVSLNGSSRQTSLLKPRAERYSQRPNQQQQQEQFLYQNNGKQQKATTSGFPENVNKRVDKSENQDFLFQNYSIMGKHFDEVKVNCLQNLQSIIELKKEESNLKSTSSSPAINTSRMNLLQALNKAKNQTLSALRGQNPPQQHQLQQRIQVPALAAAPVAKGANIKSRQETKSPQSTSSEDSPEDSHGYLPFPIEENPLEKAEESQEHFLKLMGLFTHEYCQYLKQRRSKRRRRNVQKNAKSDYHYGSLDLFEKQNRKKRTFLSSPPATKTWKRKRPENDKEFITAVEKEIASGSRKSSSSVDRSTSSSPDQKLVCNECLKSDDAIYVSCEGCGGYYHIKCHDKNNLSTEELFNIQAKLCPACYRGHTRENCRKAEMKAKEENLAENNSGKLTALLVESLSKDKQIINNTKEALIKKYTKVRNELINSNKPYRNRMNCLIDITKRLKQSSFPHKVAGKK